MDPNKRIEELENQVRHLSGLVQQLVAERGSVPQAAEPSPDADAPAEPSKAKEVYGADVSRNVNKVLGGEPGEPLESRIGGIWLSRVAVVSLMTAAVLGARVTLHADELLPIYKVLLFYGVAMLAVLYGLIFRKERDLFAQAILGTGLAAFYFTTYAAFFVEGMVVVETPMLAPPLLFGCLIVLAIVAHRRRSETVAGVWLFLAYYTIVLSCIDGENASHVVYALGACTLLALTALVFHALHRWLLFTWVAMIATHLSYIYFFLDKPAGLNMSDKDYFWVSNGFLFLVYVVFTVACIMDARKTGEYRRTVAPMSGVNSFVFFCLTWIAIRQNYIEYEWLFRTGFTLMLFLFAILAETTGPRRNYLFQVLIAKTVIMFTLALQAYLSGEKLMVAMALESLALGFSFKRSGVVSFKILGMGLLILTSAGCLLSSKNLQLLDVFGYQVQANWFCGLGAPLVFVVVAWFFEHFIRRVKPEERVVSGQWFLADTFLDVHGATVAMWHAAAAAMILLTVTIMDQGDNPALPFMLGGEGVAMAALGFVLRTPQVEAASVMLVLAAHVCFHAFLIFGLTPIEQQESYVVYTILLAMFTFLGAYFWERYLKRVKGGKPWEHDILAAIPYLTATFMLTTLIGRSLDPLHAAAGQNALAVALLLTGAVTHYNGMKASGIMAFGIGIATVYKGMYTFASPIQRDPQFIPYFTAFLIAFAAGERLLKTHGTPHASSTQLEDVLRTMLVVAGVSLGLLGLFNWCTGHGLTLYWLVLALSAFMLGAVFHESRYRWAAIAVFAITIGRAYIIDLRQLAPVYKFLSFAGLTIALGIVSLAYSRRRSKMLESQDAQSKDDAAAE